jgi:hypothetical protein
VNLHFSAAVIDALKPRYKKLGFYITQVRSVVETDEVGSDEILLSGFGVAPTGAMTGVPIWKVTDDFDEGDTVDPVQPRLFVEFDLTAGSV